MIIAQYKGVSIVSRIIKKFTRSQWSHTAIVFRDDSVFESWHKNGVSHIDSLSLLDNLSANHTPGTKVDLFKIASTTEQEDRFEKFLLSHENEKYDFRSVWRFLSRAPALRNKKWFCSELAVEALNHVDIYPQERIKSSEMSPQLLGISPILIPAGQITTV